MTQARYFGPPEVDLVTGQVVRPGSLSLQREVDDDAPSSFQVITRWRNSQTGAVVQTPTSQPPDASGNWSTVPVNTPLTGAAPPSTPGAAPTSGAPPTSAPGLNDDPYAAFKQRFQQEYGRAITQEEMNDNKKLVSDLGISNDLFRLLPLDRQMGFDAKRLSLLDNKDVMRLVEHNPQVAGSFWPDFWKRFSNDWLASTVGPFLSKANPAEWGKIVTQNQIGGVDGGALPPELRPGTAPTGAPVGTTAGTPAAPAAPVDRSAAPIKPFQQTTVPALPLEAGGVPNALDLFLGMIGASNFGQAPGVTGTTPTGGSKLAGLDAGIDLTRPAPTDHGEEDDREHVQIPGVPGTQPVGSKPVVPSTDDGAGPSPNVPTDQQFIQNPAWTPTGIGSLEPRFIKNPFYRDPSAGPQATYANIAYQRERDQIERGIREAERAADAAERAGNAEEARRQFDIVQDLRERQFSLDRQAQAEQTAETGRQFDIGTFGFSQGAAGGAPTLEREVASAGNERANAQLQASNALNAAQIALQRGDQAEAQRQFNIATSFAQQITVYDREIARRRDPASFLDKIAVSRGGAAGAAPVAPGLTIGAQGQFVAPTQQAAGPAPLTAGEILGGAETPQALKTVFGAAPTGRLGMAAGGAPTSFRPISQQDVGDLTGLEQQALDAAVLATGEDPTEFRRRSRRLSTGSFGGVPSYAA